MTDRSLAHRTDPDGLGGSREGIHRLAAVVAVVGVCAAGTGAEAGWALWRYARDPEQPSLSWEMIASADSAEACQAELAVQLEYDDAPGVYFCLPATIDPRLHEAAVRLPGGSLLPRLARRA